MRMGIEFGRFGAIIFREETAIESSINIARTEVD